VTVSSSDGLNREAAVSGLDYSLEGRSSTASLVGGISKDLDSRHSLIMTRAIAEMPLRRRYDAANRSVGDGSIPIGQNLTIPSVVEIAVLRSTAIVAEVQRRGTDGKWPSQPEIVDAEGGRRLASIGFIAPL
jgi:hypothetical protein